MANQQKFDSRDEISAEDLFRPILRYRRIIWQGTLIAVLAAAVIGGAALFLQSTREVVTVGFRPVFTGVDKGEYPNETPFATADIVDQTIVDKVVATNNIQQYCSATVFRGGLTVQERSPARQFLDLEFQARLSDARLTAVDRQRLQEEFQARRMALPRAYHLTLIRPPECVTLPTEVALKAVQDVLESWATESQESRNVLKLQVSVLSPAIFDETNSGDVSALLVRADVLRSGITRVIANIAEVEQIPGAVLVRVGDRKIGLAEVRVELENLLQSRIDPLLMVVGQSLGRSSQIWVRQALQAATIRLQAAQQRAEAYRTALREYSGIQTAAVSPPGSAPDRPSGASDVQALTPQIDQTFIDRIVGMSEANTTFRQEVTRSGIEAAVEAVDRAAVVDHYRHLLAGMEGTPRREASDEQMARELTEITALAKDATRRFNEIYDEVSRVALRAGSQMYRIVNPPAATSARAFSLRAYGLLILAALVVSPILLAGAALIYHFVRRLVAQAQPPPA